MWKTVRSGATISMIVLVLMNAASVHSSGILTPSGVSVVCNGTFEHQRPNPNAMTQSDNGRFWCQYDIGRVSDEYRELENFRLYEGNHLLFGMENVPGSDMYISNSGIVAFLDYSRHFQQDLTVHFYSKDGEFLSSESYTGAFLFGFSATGSCFGVGTPAELKVVSVPRHRIDRYARGFQFDISEDENMVAVASEGKISVYEKGKLIREIPSELQYTRKVRISTKYNTVAAIDKRNLQVYALGDGKLMFRETLAGKESYRDLMFDDGKVVTGIHFRDGEISKGIMKTYDLSGRVVFEREEVAKSVPAGRRRSSDLMNQPPAKSDSRQDPIPWMFSPFDSMRTAWNYYEQHMGDGYSDWSYLHQGLDLIVPIAEPVYAVETGVVKCVLTIGGGSYWRTAISPEQSPGWSDGWLYAHLIENTIQFEVGDSVHIHDYLGDIVEWSGDWGHIHFVQIHDSGTVWFYDDDEWGINFNPLLVLEPDSDWSAPVIEDVFPYSKFGFCINETSHYLRPDSLFGDIDIIAQVEDHIGLSEWQQPAFSSYYWVNQVPENVTIFPRTLGHVLNHTYPFYATSHFESYATVLYKRDETLPAPSWMDTTRNYYHILTNNNGDSLIELSEADLAFPTENYPDGWYRIFVEAWDQYGNSTVDSQDVRFQNSTAVPSTGGNKPNEFRLEQNYPNPFNSGTVLNYSLSHSSIVTLSVFNILGQEVRTLVNGFQNAGEHEATFDGNNLTSGIYFFRLKAQDWNQTRKMLLIR